MYECLWKEDNSTKRREEGLTLILVLILTLILRLRP